MIFFSLLYPVVFVNNYFFRINISLSLPLFVEQFVSHSEKKYNNTQPHCPSPVKGVNAFSVPVGNQLDSRAHTHSGHSCRQIVAPQQQREHHQALSGEVKVSTDLRKAERKRKEKGNRQVSI